MSDNIKSIGILRETKEPPDRRVPITPGQIASLMVQYPDARFLVQPSELRCYSDEEYKSAGVELTEDLSGCDILMGVKEVDKETFIADKRYLFFAHVGKEQPHNRDMFRELVRERITLTDYEYLIDKSGARVVAFGRWAGVVGAYNGLRAAGIKSGRFELKRAADCRDFQELVSHLRSVTLPDNYRIVVTGGGRVASGAVEILEGCGIQHASPSEYLQNRDATPLYCRIGPEHYTRRREGGGFDWNHFIENPGQYESTFAPYAAASDLFIACHYWDPASPSFFSGDDVKDPGFRISVVADISCDIGGPIPTTLRASTIDDPFFDYNREDGTEESPFSDPSNITVMSIDNLPGELPRDASEDFGQQLIKSVIDDLIRGVESDMLAEATITREGRLTPKFDYLEGYLKI